MIPKTQHSLVLRTDFSDEFAWESICKAIREPVGDFRAYVDVLSDSEYDGLTVEQLTALVPKGSTYTFMFIVDGVTFPPPVAQFLLWICTTSLGIYSVLFRLRCGLLRITYSTTNMDFSEFANVVDQNGIFREFPRN